MELTEEVKKGNKPVTIRLDGENSYERSYDGKSFSECLVANGLRTGRGKQHNIIYKNQYKWYNKLKI